MNYFKILSFLLVFLTVSCGTSKQNTKEGGSEDASSTADVTSSIEDTESSIEDTASRIPPSESIDLNNKGIGPITSIIIPKEIDEELAARGKKVHSQKCIACHNPYKKLIGPAPFGILKRRTPEWVMNMIINPEEMLQKDPLAKALLEEFYGVVMSSQSISEGDARAILEYYRTL